MKKGLLAVVTILACALVGAGIATAAEISTSGTIEFKISGTSEEGAVSGTFGAGDVLVDYNVEVTSGPWGAVVSPEFDIGGEALTECDAYITYTSDMFTLTLDPTGIDYGLYDLYAYGKGKAIDGGPNIPSNPGIKVEIPFEPVTLTVVVNNQEEIDESGEGTGKLLFNYGVGLDYEMESLTLGLMANSSPLEYTAAAVPADTTTDSRGDTVTLTPAVPAKKNPWYGTSYGVKVEYDMAPMTFIGEYGTFSPSTDGYKSGSGYYAELSYETEETGTFKLSYKSADKYLNVAGNPEEANKAYSKIYAEWSYPVTDAVTFTADVTSEDKGFGGDTVTSYEAKIGISF